MIPTPDLSHLSSEDKQHVYNPAEDTFLLLDGLEKDVEQLKSRNPLICLEIGSGSGCVSTFLGSILGPTNSLILDLRTVNLLVNATLVYLCTDINNRASVCTLATAKQNKVPLDPITCDLSRPLLARLRHSVDIILFNPPYVPTACEEFCGAQSDASIAGSWAGGPDGMEVTNRFLDSVADLLSDRGVFYLVALAQNNIPEIRARMMKQFNMNSRVRTTFRGLAQLKQGILDHTAKKSRK